MFIFRVYGHLINGRLGLPPTQIPLMFEHAGMQRLFEFCADDVALAPFHVSRDRPDVPDLDEDSDFRLKNRELVEKPATVFGDVLDPDIARAALPRTIAPCNGDGMPRFSTILLGHFRFS